MIRTWVMTGAFLMLGCQPQQESHTTSQTAPALVEADPRLTEPSPTEGSPRPEATPRPAPPIPPRQEDSTLAPVAASPVRGPAGAPVTVMVFSNFGCSYCQKTAAPGGALAQLEEAFEGSIRVVFKHAPFPIDAVEMAHQASAAAHLQGQFWPFHDAMFSLLDPAGAGGTPSRDDVVAAASGLGLDIKKFIEDLDSVEVELALVQDLAVEMRLSRATPEEGSDAVTPDIEGTPSYLINGRAVGNRFYYLNEAVTEELAAYEVHRETLDPQNFYRTRVEANLSGLVIPPALTARIVEEDDNITPPTLTAADPMLGHPDALVPVLIFTDLSSADSRAAMATAHALKAAHPSEVVLVAFPTPMDDAAPKVSQAGLMLHGQARFWDYEAALRAGPVSPDIATLVSAAEVVGGDAEALSEALSENLQRDAVNRVVGIATSLDVTSTPTLFVGGQKLAGVADLATLEAAFATQRARAATLKEAGLGPDARLRGLFASP